MKARSLFLTLFVVLGLIALSGAILGAHVASRMELATISVHDRNEGTRVTVPIPAGLIRGAVGIPIFFGCDDDRVGDVRRLKWIMRESSASLATIPDMTLLEVEDGTGHVTIRKEGENLQLRVSSPDADVKVTVPHRAL